MRISDWSSDVCSSDLFPNIHIDAIAGDICAEVIDFVEKHGARYPGDGLTHLQIVQKVAGRGEETVQDEEVIDRHRDKGKIAENWYHLGHLFGRSGDGCEHRDR